MKLKKVMLNACMVLCITALSSIPVKAESNEQLSNDPTMNIYEELTETQSDNSRNVDTVLYNMDIDELNELIDCAKESSENPYARWDNSLDLAWKAAAQIAIKAGYPCAGKLVTYSVNNDNYTEGLSGTPGLFGSKIRNCSIYKDYIRSISMESSSGSSIAFTQNVDSDLYFALHKVDIFVTPRPNYVAVKIVDTFDFEKDKDRYDNLFASLVNNWGWLSQQVGSLHPIKVNVSFYA
ncbi:MAG: hypothetical protein Q4F88_06720 [Eubacteriales bacterium]|nr:hypothetical protein [Eubacteriales bacterium]